MGPQTEAVGQRMAGHSVGDHHLLAFRDQGPGQRRYGEGCLEAWERDQGSLTDRAREALAPTLTTLERSAFVCGAEPTLADAALFGQLAMLRIGGRDPGELGKPLATWLERLPRAVG